MTRRADCVIVGAGVIGLSIAYHLARRGLTDVVVMEKEPLIGTGSTGRCAGGIRRQFSHRTNIELSKLSISKLEVFEQELEQPLDFHRDGYLFLLTDPLDVQAFRAQIATQHELGVSTELLDPDELPRLLPGTELRQDDLQAISYSPDDGVSDPAGVTEGYRRAAARLGVAVETGREVTAIDRHGPQITGVRVGPERILTPCVVNAAGPHAGLVGRLAGVDVPVVPLRRFIWTTRPFKGSPSRWTLVIDFRSGFYFHREGDGVLFGMGDRDSPPTFDLSVDQTFFENVVLDVGPRRFPALAHASIRLAWAGSYETSPDANPILGRVPGVEGLILANGFSGHGFQHAPAVGELIAEEILDGAATTLDIGDFSIRRFREGRRTEVEQGVV